MATSTLRGIHYSDEGLRNRYVTLSNDVNGTISSITQKVTPALGNYIREFVLGYRKDLQTEIVEDIDIYLECDSAYLTGLCMVDFHLKLIYAMIDMEKEDNMRGLTFKMRDGSERNLDLWVNFFDADWLIQLMKGA